LCVHDTISLPSFSFFRKKKERLLFLYGETNCIEFRWEGKCMYKEALGKKTPKTQREREKKGEKNGGPRRRKKERTELGFMLGEKQEESET
jgi:hypothetical protein